MSFEKVPSFLVNFFEAEMNDDNSCSYRFYSFLLDVKERQLTNGNVPVPLTPKAFDVLAYLVTHGGHLVHKDELMQAVWPDSFVDEVNLPRTIHTLRKILGDDGNGNKFIETVPTKGYRFVAKIKVINESGSDLRPADSIVQDGAVFAEVNNDRLEIHTNGKIKSSVLETGVEARSGPRFAIVLSGVVLIIALAGGLWLFKRSGAASAVYHRITPETFSGEALQNYTQGKVLVERRHDGDYDKALELFEKAIELDPNYSNAYAGKADVKVVQFWSSGKLDDIMPARTAVRKALELDPSSSYAHAVYCRILTTVDWDHKEAEKECRIAVELNSNEQEAQRELAFFLNSFGQEVEALAAMDKAITISPTSFNKRSRGMILYQSHRYDDAIAQLEQVEETDPHYRETTRWLIRAHEMKGDFPGATACYIRYMEEFGATTEETATVRAAFEIDGWPAVMRHMAENPHLKTFFLAGTYTQLGEKEKALATLGEMFKRRSVLLVMAAREPTLEPLRGDPRFRDLLKGVGLE